VIDPLAKEVSKSFISTVPTTLWYDSQWSDIFNLPNKNRGIFAEKWLQELLTIKGYKVGKGIPSGPGKKGCDLLVNNNIRVEVKISFARRNQHANKLSLDEFSWPHLDETTADVYALIGINPDKHLDYHVRRGWRTKHEPHCIIYLLQEDLEDLINAGIAASIFNNWQLGGKFLQRIDYGYHMRDFPY
tara:strand:- start:98 stop:661 length:564 start_codon:yes stop_codon:yes gene_type:complete